MYRTLPSRSIRAVYAVQCFCSAVVFVSAWLMHWFVAPQPQLGEMSLVVAIAFVPALAVVFWPSEVPHWLLCLALALAALATSYCIHLGGGAESVLGPLAYVIWIGLAGLVLSESAAFATAALAGVSYAAVIWGETMGWWPHYPLDARYPELVRPINVTLILLGAAWVVSYGVRQIRLAHERAEQLRTEAVNALSHDLKNPLTAVIGLAAVLQEATQGEEAQYAARIGRAACQATDLVHNVLESASMEIGELRPERRSFPINPLIDEVFDIYEPGARAHGLRMHRDIANDLPPVSGDPQMLRRAIANLVSNAIKYNRYGGHVEVTARAADGSVAVAVSDTGPGLTSTEMGRLFRKFGRLRSGSGPEGTGLGLYIVKMMTEACGGSVQVESTPGEGSTFTLLVPAGSEGPRSSHSVRAGSAPGG